MIEGAAPQTTGPGSQVVEAPPLALAPGAVDGDLVVPEGWLVHDLVVQRLQRQLGRLPSWVAGVVAPGAPLPAGSSYRSFAEHRALQPLSAVDHHPRHAPVRGAGLLRAGVEGTISDEGLRVDGPLVIDRGSHAHDPWLPAVTANDAGLLARSPFSWRPVVVFLAVERDPDGADRARNLANKLIDLDIEARVAAHDVPAGRTLHAPCLPNAASLRSLLPDVVVALDPTALRLAPQWCAASRTTVLVASQPGVGPPVELVSWKIGAAQGRLRARITDAASARDIAALTQRLVAGPHPMAPRDLPADAGAAVTVRTRPREVSVAATVLRGVVDTATSDRLDALAATMEAVGASVTDGVVEDVLTSAATTDRLLVLSGLSQAPGLRDVVAERTAAGLATVVDLTPGDVVAQSGDLTPELAALRDLDIRLLCPSEALRERLVGSGIPLLWIPTLLHPARIEELRHARTDPEDFESLVLGWHLGSPVDRDQATIDAVADAIAVVADERLTLSIELVGDLDRTPDALRGHPRVSIHPRGHSGRVLDTWSAQVWTPTDHELVVIGEFREFYEPSYVGVATICTSAAAQAIGGPALCDTVVRNAHDTTQWEELLRTLLGEDAQTHKSRRIQIMRRTQDVAGPDASGDVVRRLIGWAERPRPDT
ncbi:MAG: hypothetical protein JJU45_20225 [Acidimicrobiia bacterium]|nr:hypothetical protein [Acidimicrobiia bacterium]